MEGLECAPIAQDDWKKGRDGRGMREGEKRLMGSKHLKVGTSQDPSSTCPGRAQQGVAQPSWPPKTRKGGGR